jgi:hypothetical protein
MKTKSDFNCGVTSIFWELLYGKYVQKYNDKCYWQALERQYKESFYNASGGTQFFRNLILNKFLAGVAGTFPSTLYVGLSSTLPTDAPASNWNVTEPSTGGYARQSITVGTAAWATVSAGSTSNAAIINWGTASATLLSGVNLTDWVMFDASTSGNLHLWADLTTPQPVFNGNPYSIAIGALVIGGI